MAIEPGTRRLKTWSGDYDFAVDGGGTGTITLRSDDGPLPNGSVVLGGVLKITTILASSGSATGALQVNAANDIISATAFDGAPFSSTGNKDIVPDSTGSTAITLTADRSPAFLIAAAALTGGKFTLTLIYR